MKQVSHESQSRNVRVKNHGASVGIPVRRGHEAGQRELLERFMPISRGRCDRNGLRHVRHFVSREYIPEKIKRRLGSLLEDVHAIAVRADRTDISRQREIVERGDHILPLHLELIHQRKRHYAGGIFAPLSVNVNTPRL